MKRMIPELFRLIPVKHRPQITTANLRDYVNRIPVYHQDYANLQIGDLPSMQARQHRFQLQYNVVKLPVRRAEEVERQSYGFSELLSAFWSRLDYLELEEAKDWLRTLDVKELEKNRTNLDLLHKYVSESLSEKVLEGYVEQAAIEFIEVIVEAKNRISGNL